MSYVEKHKKYSFLWVLNEVNYGALEKDDRIKKINTLLKKSLYDNLSKGILDEKIIFVTESKYKVNMDITCLIKWNIKVSTIKNPTFFADTSHITTPMKYEEKYYGSILKLHFIRAEGISDKEFTNQMLEFITSNEIDKILLHEIKHFLDDVDNLFMNNKYISSKDMSKYSKYLSQNKEIDAQLISVLSDLDKIKDDNPFISLETALKQSHTYNNFIDNLTPSKINKYKQKIIYFWSET